MKLKKKICYVISVIMTLAILVTACFVPAFSPTDTLAEEGGLDKTKLYAFAYISKIDSLGKNYVTFGVCLDFDDNGVIDNTDLAKTRVTQAESNIQLFETVTLYVRTRNYTAVAELGDYTPYEEVVTIHGADLYHAIILETFSSGLQMGDKTRQFIFEIYKAEITGVNSSFEFVDPSLSPQYSMLKLATGSDYTMMLYNTTYGNGTLDYMPEMRTRTWGTSLGYKEEATIDRRVTINSDLSTLSWSEPEAFEKLKYLSKNNIMKLGVGVSGNIYQGSGSWFYVENGFAIVQLYTGGGPNRGGRKYGEWYIKFQSDQYESSHFTNKFEGQFEGYNVKTYLSSETAYSWKYGDNRLVSNTECFCPTGVIVLEDLESLLGDGTELSVCVYKHESLDDDLFYDNNLHVDYSVVNYRGKINNATVGDLRIDENGRTKIGLSVRFSEPLQLMKYSDGTETKMPVITGYLSGNSANKVDFNYVDGDGTDTFYFEADVTDCKTNITSIRLSDQRNFDDVLDYPGDKNGNFNPLTLKISGGALYGWENISSARMDCSFDLRTPRVSRGGTISSMVKTSHSPVITTEDVNSSGTVQYGWVTDDTTVPEKLSVARIQEQGFQTIPSPVDMSGTRYLYVKAVSEIGRESEPVWLGPFYFDNDEPTISLECSNDSYKSTNFTLKLKNKSENIESFTKFAELKKSIQVNVSKDKAGGDVVKTFSIPIADEYLNQETVELSFTLAAADLGLAVGTEAEYGYFYITFSASDVLDNSSTTEPYESYFDIRDVFDVERVKYLQDEEYELDLFKSGGELASTLEAEYFTVDLSKLPTDGSGLPFRFKVANVAEDDEAIQMGVGEFVNVATGESLLTEYVDVSGSNSLVTLTIKKKVPSGLYKLVFNDARSEKLSIPQYAYVTNGLEDETGGYNQVMNNRVLTNDVFQLSTSVPYYYATDIGNIQTKQYTDSGRPATFSSWWAAVEYLMFYEYQDLYGITITQSMADDLNNNLGSYRKADGVKVEAKAGQNWIRYKDADWRPNSTTNSWVYYYYEGEFPINTDALPAVLSVAINSVAATICTYGSYADLVTEGNLDANGAPTLSPEQIYTQMLSATQSMSGTPFSSPVQYVGDSGIYTALDPNAPLATNVTIQNSPYRRIYYKTETAGYRLLTDVSSKALGQHYTATGTLTLLELDEYGAREYNVYVDNTAPTLFTSWQTPSGTPGYKDFDENAVVGGTTLSGSNFSIDGISDYDAYAFVAIYRYVNQGEGDLLYVLRAIDFEGGISLALEDGKYHIHVSDRSGNDYAFVYQLNSDPLICSVKEVENSHIQIDINRTEAEVTYKVYLDDWLLTTNYSERRFSDSGNYRILIEDIYGNVYDEYYYDYEYAKDTVTGEYLYDSNGNKIPVLDSNGNKIPVMVNGEHKAAYYVFKRDLPVVTWRYQDSTGTMQEYDANTSVEMRIAKSGENSYVISTSTYMQFLLPQDCTYTIIDGKPNAVKNDYTRWVSFRNLSSFTMMVFYERHPETYVSYTCTIDSSAPVVGVSYKESLYEMSEYRELAELFSSGKLNEGNNVFTPSFIGFEATEESSAYVANGGVAHSRYFRVSVSDESGVSRVEVYLDGELILRETRSFNNITLSRFGNYEIRAYDSFANESIFTFTNSRYTYIDYYVDGNAISTDESPLQWFDYEQKLFTKVDYGHSDVRITVSDYAALYYIITGEDGEKHFLFFAVDGGAIYPVTYSVEVGKETEDGEVVVKDVKRVRGAAIVGLPDVGTEIGRECLLSSISSIGVAVYASFGADGRISITVRSTDSAQKTYTVDARVVVDDNISPYYVKAEISNVSPEVAFTDANGNDIEADEHNLKINKAFKVSDAIGEDIASVRVSASKTGKYETYQTVFDGTYTSILFTEECMYHVEVVNKYGVVTDYYIIMSSKFMVTAAVQLADGTLFEYSSNYVQGEESRTIYSNNSVEFIIYSTGVKVSVNGEEVSVTQSAQGYTEIFINTAGTSVVRIWDEYGNAVESTVEISLQSVTGAEELLTGFNENALRGDEGYTNTKVSVDAAGLTENGIHYVSITDGSRTVVLYDMISEQNVEFNEAVFKDCVGSMGDGEYRVTFRDRYGNKAERTVIYRGTSTLKIIRTTVNGLQAEEYPIETMLEKGVWTNNSVYFEVSATEYVLKVDGMENVTSISFDTKTKNEYAVSYIDEYGFSYEFTVHLFRQEITVEAADSMRTAILSDILTTKDDVSVVFTENATCTYTFNGGEEHTYNAGDSLYKDGLYRFRAVDIAGNVATYTVKKDSIVEYRLEGSGVGEVMINGSVTNGTSVKFYPVNSDTAYIKKVFHNNEMITYDDVEFTERGKWEIIVADEVGNESYFRFYILRGRMDGFLYNVPYDYVISSVRWELDGSQVMASEAIKNEGKTLEAKENGNYDVVLTSLVTGDELKFSFTVDKTPPQVKLEGCKENEKTINNVTISGHEVGDTIYVYKDGVLTQTVTIGSAYSDAPVISEGGKYKIVVQNEAGVTTELEFERKFIPNVAGSMLIIIVTIACAIMLLVGLIWRNHSKTDN